MQELRQLSFVPEAFTDSTPRMRLVIGCGYLIGSSLTLIVRSLLAVNVQIAHSNQTSKQRRKSGKDVGPKTMAKRPLRESCKSSMERKEERPVPSAGGVCRATILTGNSLL